jgi:stearoyl-CoA desaturase (delta-9 desaturase)
MLLAWLDADTPVAADSGAIAKWLRCAPFIALHLGCLAVIAVGVSWPAVGCAVFLYCFRVFALTAFYHRYFSHRAYKASRFWQFVFAVCAMTAAQRGPLWWAAHHRHHHLHSDTEKDAHSPRFGFLRSHLGWFTDARNFPTDYERIADFAKYPELVFLNRFDALVPAALFVALYAVGEAIGASDPAVSGWQFVVWGGCISTVAVYHATFCVNSLCHIFGRRRFRADDDSRNNWLVAILTFGEGWHNNHHRYPAAARQGFYWWEADITYYLLRLLEKLGVISDLKTVPKAVLEEGRRAR